MMHFVVDVEELLEKKDKFKDLFLKYSDQYHFNIAKSLLCPGQAQSNSAIQFSHY